MSAAISLAEASTQLAQLVERVTAGEEIIIAQDGRPVARLVPVLRPRCRQPGLLKGRMVIGADFDSPLPQDIAVAFAGGQP